MKNYGFVMSRAEMSGIFNFFKVVKYLVNNINRLYRVLPFLLCIRDL